MINNLENQVTQPSHLQASAQYLDIGLPDWRDDPQIGPLLRHKEVQLCGSVQD